MPSRKELIDQLLDMLLSTSDPERSFGNFKGAGEDEVVLMVNNLGGISELELGGISRETLSSLSSRKIKVQRILVGSFMVRNIGRNISFALTLRQTSLNMPGFSLTLLLLPRSDSKVLYSTDKILGFLDAKPQTPGWKWNAPSVPVISASMGSQAESFDPPSSNMVQSGDSHKFVEFVEKACRSLIQAEPEITRLDSIAGDGDCGLTLKGGAEGMLRDIQIYVDAYYLYFQATLDAIKRGLITGSDVLRSVLVISRIAEEKMGGTSGALYS